MVTSLLSIKVITPEVMLSAMRCYPRPLLADLVDPQGRCQSVPRDTVLRQQAMSVLSLSNHPSKAVYVCFLPRKRREGGSVELQLSF